MTLTDESYWFNQYGYLDQVISGKRFWSDGTPVAGQQYEYGFDDIGNRASAKSGGDSAGANLRSASYTPNLVNQYTARTNPGEIDILGIAAPAATVTVNAGSHRRGEYFHKALTVSNSSALWQSLTNKAVNGATSNTVTGFKQVAPASESLTYDTDGNLTTDGLWTYTWDGENRLKQMDGTAATGAALKLNFDYDHLGRRIRKAVVQGTTTNTFVKFVYDGWNLLAELNATNNAVIRSYIWGTDLSGSMQDAGGAGGLLAVKSTTATYFVAPDGSGNVVALYAGNSGDLTAQYEYDSFGQTIRKSGSASSLNPIQFSTKYLDSETGYSYYGHRFYNASTGRWLSRDPLEEEGGINLFAFVGNNPVSFIDFVGLAKFEKLPLINSTFLPGNTWIVPINNPANTFMPTKPTTLATTAWRYHITKIDCQCRIGGTFLKKIEGNYQAIVFYRESYLNKKLANWVKSKEMDHVNDLYKWANSAKSYLGQVEKQYKSHAFSSVTQCEKVVSEEINGFLPISFDLDFRDSGARWDGPPGFIHTWRGPF